LINLPLLYSDCGRLQPVRPLRTRIRVIEKLASEPISKVKIVTAAPIIEAVAELVPEILEVTNSPGL
jgi:hypothetical protein